MFPICFKNDLQIKEGAIHDYLKPSLDKVDEEFPGIREEYRRQTSY